MSRAVDSTARAMAGEALSRLDNGGSGSGGTTVDAYSKLETDNLLNAKVDDVEFSPIKALAESNEINITYLANNKAEKTEVNALSELVADIDSEVDLKANKADVYTKAETNTAISDKVAEIVANAPEDFDTLKEMSDWIDSHEESASAMNTAIKQNTSDIANLKATDETTATEIASVKSDVAINRTTLGVQCKNLLPFLASITKKGIVFSCNALGYMSASSTDSDDRQWTYDMAQYSVRLQPGDYILSFHSSTVCTNAYGNIMVLSADSTKLCSIGQSNYVNNTTGVAAFTITTEQTVYVMSKIFDGITALMIRHADITDDTYEPYKTSLQEQITTNTTDISAILARVEALETALASQEA